MFRRRIGWIGIDIGSRSVKVAQVERDLSGNLRLRQAAVIPRQTPWPDGDDGVNAPPQKSAGEILAAINYGERFAGHFAACVLPMHVYAFRGLQIPDGTHNERRAMIAGTLDETWDEAREACEFDFWETNVRDRKSRADEPNVNVLAVSRRWTQQTTEDAAGSLLQLQVLDGPPLAMARAVKLTAARRGKSPEAVIDWGFTSTTFCIVDDGRALFTRRVRSCGLRLLCEGIQTSLGISLEETQHLLLTFGLPCPGEDRQVHPVQVAIAEAAVEQLGRIAEEIRRTLGYFQAQRRELLPDKIWLVGGGASILNVADWLSAACEVPVKTWRLSPESQSNDHSARNKRENEAVCEPLLAEAIALSALPLEDH